MLGSEQARTRTVICLGSASQLAPNHDMRVTHISPTKVLFGESNALWGKCESLPQNIKAGSGKQANKREEVSPGTNKWWRILGDEQGLRTSLLNLQWSGISQLKRKLALIPIMK